MNSLFAIIIWTCIISVRITITAWNISSQPLPIVDRQMAVGAYNGTIFLLGGLFTSISGSSWQPMQYTIATDTFTNTGGTPYDGEVRGFGQHFTQIEHIIYMIDPISPQFTLYNMITKEFITFANSIVFNTAVSSTGCLASNFGYLYITGGSSYNESQILNLSTNEWLINPPSMNQKRHSHSCVVHNEYLWVFGGYEDEATDIQIASNERILTKDITKNGWDFIDPLSIGIGGSRAVAWFHIIYIIGGYDDRVNDKLHLVDALTGTVTLAADNLPLNNGEGAPVIVDAVLYIFGGFYSKKLALTDSWAYYPLPTQTTEPTLPSSDPTATPSSKPTMPTSPPSHNPTLTTGDPTVSFPTNSSSIYAGNTSTYLSLNPTSNATSNPTSHPTLNPTPNPTSNPTSNPTTDAAFYSTFYTISIQLNECENDEGQCEINKDNINNILIAYIDDVQILRTDIMDNNIVVILIALHDDESVLDSDVIAIQNELELKYGDVDVIIEETDDHDEEDDKTVKRKLFSDFILIIIAVVVGALCGAIIATYFLYNYFTVKKQAHDQQQQIIHQLAITGIPTDDALSDTVNSGTGIAIASKPQCIVDEEKVDDKDSDSDHDSLYETGRPNLATVQTVTSLTTEGENGDNQETEEGGPRSKHVITESEQLYCSTNATSTKEARDGETIC